MRIVTVVGARPQFVKAAPMSRVLRANHDEYLIHTGQHYDYEMSRVFFEGLDIPEPDINLAVGSGGHGAQTGTMLTDIAEVLTAQRPDLVLVYGDTNSTLAAALAAAKLSIPIAHVEAGLRSHNRAMPEEINRIMTDRVSTLLLCPTRTAVDHLRREGIDHGVSLPGDVMYDVAAWAATRVSAERGDLLNQFGVDNQPFCLATIHRPSNTDDQVVLAGIVRALTNLPTLVVWPLHPRTRAKLESFDMLHAVTEAENIRLLPPLGYLEFVGLLVHADVVMTDSGGIQKEACFHQTPCVTLRDETEWVETVAAGWNVLAGADPDRIRDAFQSVQSQPRQALADAELMDGRAAQRINNELEGWFEGSPASYSAAVPRASLNLSNSVRTR